MTFSDPSPDSNVASNIIPPADKVPPSVPQADAGGLPSLGEVPPQVLAQRAAAGQRGAAWRLIHWIMVDDPRAVLAVTSLDDDRLMQHLLEFLALGTWAGKLFIVSESFRTPHARTRLRTLLLPGVGGDPVRAERVLLAATHDRRPAIRETALYILGMMGSPAVTPVLSGALNDPVYRVRVQAARVLGHSGDPAAVAALMRALHTDDEPLGSYIYVALLQLGAVALPAVLDECMSASPWVRWHCMRVLGESVDLRALPVLVPALNDADYSIAWIAAKSLVRFGKACLVPVLRLLVVSEMSPWLKETASYVLRALYQRDARLKPYLEPILHSMHGVAGRIATPNVANRVLVQLAADGVIDSN